MTTRIVKTKIIQVPADIILAVAKVLADNDINNTIVKCDEENELIDIEVDFEAEQRAAIHEIEDYIEDFEEDDQDEEE